MENKLPEFVLDMLKEQYGEENAKLVLNGFSKKRKTTLRVNTQKSSIDEIKSALEKDGFDIEISKKISNAIILLNKCEEDVIKLDIYNEGKIYLQSISSMLPPVILDPKENENILDMAAAPGSKTTQMYNLALGKCYITACEKNKIRAERLKYNIAKQGASRVSVLNIDSRKLDDFMKFDKILLDSPCSGVGTICLEDESSYKYITKELIERCVSTQKQLIKKALKLLKKGGELVYSTCSILKQENEDIINYILESGEAEVIELELNNFRGLETTICGTLCILPTNEQEGFFVAKLRKK